MNGTSRIYIPDILVMYADGSCVLEEIKGYVAKEHLEMFEMKNKAAENFCSSKEWKFRVLFEKDLEIV